MLTAGKIWMKVHENPYYYSWDLAVCLKLCHNLNQLKKTKFKDQKLGTH